MDQQRNEFRVEPAKRSRFSRRGLRLALMLAPVLLVLVVLYLGALLAALAQSLGYAPIYGVSEFPTGRYYAELFGSSTLWKSLWLTLYYAIVPTVLGTVLSIVLALSLRQHFAGRGVMSFLYKLPLVVPYLVGVALTALLWSNGGLVARSLFALGFIESTRDFSRLLYTESGIGVMLVYLWKQIPFQTLILMSVLAGLNPDIEAAARVSGASPRQTFWFVTLPRLMPGILAATLIVFAFNFGSFEVPFLLGGNLNTLPVMAWRAFDDVDVSRRLFGVSIVVVVSAVSSLLLILTLLLYRRFSVSEPDEQ